MDIKTKKTLTAFFSKFPIKKFKKGEMILKADQNFEAVYFIKKGQVIMYRLSKKKEMQIMPTLDPIFYASLLNKALKRKNEFYYKAKSEVQVWIAPEKEAMKFMDVAMNELMNVNCLTKRLLFGDATQKVALLLTAFADKFGNKKGNEVTFGINLPHKMMANMSGVTRETVTIQLLKMEKAKLIGKNNRKMIIRDFEKLKQMAVL